MIHRVTTSGKMVEKEWQELVQQVTTTGATSDNKWQRITTINSKWQRVVITSKLPFFQTEESITKHPKEDSLNQRTWGRPWRVLLI